jgi:hypothetical protein
MRGPHLEAERRIGQRRVPCPPHHLVPHDARTVLVLGEHLCAKHSTHKRCISVGDQRDGHGL